MHSGFVHLVGAGPGDPDLLTVKALRLIQSVPLIVFDRLVSPEIMDLVPKGTSRIYAGKALNRHEMPQDEINSLLLSLARSGRQVLRLKGGDPFIYGRGSEEAGFLADHGIPFEIVPGITAASGCATYSGIPLTHRGIASSVRYLTGQRRDHLEIQEDWGRVIHPETTLVLYMGLNRLGKIARELAEAGMPADIPAAAIENGTTPRQRRVLSRLDRLEQDVVRAGFQTPTTIIIGHVVGMAERLAWFQPARNNDRQANSKPDQTGTGREENGPPQNKKKAG